MKRIERYEPRFFRSERWIMPIALWLMVCVGIAAGRPAWALDDGSADGAYVPDSATSDPGDAAGGPVRLARFSYVSGDVTWRTDAQADWSPATLNLPLRQGAQIWVADASRAEVQFDDGSRLRLDSGTLITLQTLYSDADGEFTEIALNEGLTALRLREDHSVYQVDTPLVGIKAAGPAMIRIGAGDGAQVGVQEGQATVEGPQGKTTLRSGVYLDLADDQAPYDVQGLPRPDNWDDWNAERNREMDAAVQGPAQRYLPPDIAIVADDLDDYGAWHADPTYGEVWCPRVAAADWRPYQEGRWTWVAPFGWTWVSDEPWGWAPYHYGTWLREPYGWAWAPGPAVQYWSPGSVEFYESGGNVAWCPLAPAEIRYPDTLAMGYRHGDWFLAFSIGQAAVYYPTSDDACEARPWNSEYVNCATDAADIDDGTIEHTASVSNIRRIPLNAKFGGATMADAHAFGSGGYRPLPDTGSSIFVQGRPITAPAGRIPTAGPAIVHPTTAVTTFPRPVSVPPAIVNRPVYRVPLAPAIARTSAPIAVPISTGRIPGARIATLQGAPRTSVPAPDRTPLAAGGSVRNGLGPNREPVSQGAVAPAQQVAMRFRESIGQPGSSPIVVGYDNGDGTITQRSRPASPVQAPAIQPRITVPARSDNPAPAAPIRIAEPIRRADPPAVRERVAPPAHVDSLPAQPVRVVAPVRRDDPPAQPVRSYTPAPPPHAEPVRTYAPPPPPAPTHTESGGSSQAGSASGKEKGGKH